MTERPAWVPKSVDYGRYPFVRPCFYCDNRATQGADDLQRGRSWFWCDASDCVQKARTEIAEGRSDG